MVTNFSYRLQDEGDWYNRFERHNLDTSAMSRKKKQYLRERNLTLHQYQSFSQDVICGVMFWLPGDHDAGQGIRSDTNSQLGFSISGGVEIPHFKVRLRLKYTDPKDTKSESYITVSMVWTAWDSQGFKERSIITNPATSAIAEEHSFSARLKQASMIPINLTESQAAICQGEPGVAGFQVRWACDVRPHTYGLSMSSLPMDVFNKEQGR